MHSYNLCFARLRRIPVDDTTGFINKADFAGANCQTNINFPCAQKGINIELRLRQSGTVLIHQELGFGVVKRQAEV